MIPGGQPAQAPEGRLPRYAWLPIPILLVLMLALAGARVEFPAPSLAAGLSYSTRILAALCIVVLAGRSFLDGGDLTLLLLGCGAGIWGVVDLLFSAPFVSADANLVLTLTSLGALVSAGCHLAATSLALRPGPPRVRRPGLWLGVGHALALGLVGLLLGVARTQALPVFFIEGRGGTWAQDRVLGTALVLFLGAALLAWRMRKRSANPFHAWYTWALLLMATGLLGALLQHGRNDPLEWLGRIAQALGGVWLVAAALASVEATGSWGLSLREALRSSEATLAGILNGSRESIWLFDPEGIVLMANRTALKRLGRSEVEVVGRSFLELVPPELGRSRMACLREVIATRAPVEAVDERAGMIFQHTYYPVLDAQGRVRQIAAFSSDITGRRQAEDAMARAFAQADAGRRMLAALMEHVPEGIAVADAPDGRIRLVSRYGEEQLGKSWDPSRDEPPEGKLKVFWPDGVTPMAEEEMPLRRALAGAVLQNVEVVQETRDGRRLPLLCNAAPLRDAEGTIVGAIVAWREIGELKQAQEALRASERLYRAIGEAIDYGVWVCAPDGRNTYASPSFLKLVGLTQETCSNFGWGDVLHPEDAERTLAAWKTCVETGGRWDIEHRFRGVDGRWHPILARGIAVRDERGVVTHWAGINLDIERMKDTENALKRTVEDLERTNRELEQFAFICSHDLQEPLRQVLAYTDRLKTGLEGRLDARSAQHLAFVEEGAHRMRDLIRGLLDYARAGLPGPGAGICTCDAALSTALANLRVSLQEAGALVTFQALPVVRATELQITQLFQNLVGNALKFRREGIPPRIQVGHIREGELEHLWVADNGLGIPPRFHGKVFEIFQRLHDRERFPGTGIGLAICRKIVEQNGGRLWVESEGLTGSTFHFTLRPPDRALPEGSGRSS